MNILVKVRVYRGNLNQALNICSNLTKLPGISASTLEAEKNRIQVARDEYQSFLTDYHSQISHEDDVVKQEVAAHYQIMNTIPLILLERDGTITRVTPPL